MEGHTTVAATGTIAVNGAVGDVGGVKQKAVAVSREHASVFLVPPQELAAARSAGEAHLTIVPVSTLSGALHYLFAHHLAVPAKAVTS